MLYLKAFGHHWAQSILVVVSLVLSIWGITYMTSSTYTKPYSVEVEVVDKFIGNSKYGIEAEMVFRVVKTNQVFDRAVTLSTYSTYNKGDKLMWTVTNRDLYGNKENQEIFLSLTGIFGTMFFLIMSGSLFYDTRTYIRRARQ